MSEEDIIFVLKDLIAYYKICAINKQDVFLNYQGIIAIETLLKLYQEEKEKNKMLEAPIFRNGLYSKNSNYICKDEVRDLIYDLENEIDFDGKLTELDSYCLLRAIINKLDEIIEN